MCLDKKRNNLCCIFSVKFLLNPTRNFDDIFYTVTSSRCSSNFEADTSELPENNEEMFPRLNMDTDVISWFKSSNKNICVTHRERIKQRIK